MYLIQSIIHRLEVGGGLRFLKYVLVFLGLLALVLTYNLRGFKNMSNPEAMDAAQLARNLAEHKGYTTLFIRPFSVYLLEKTYTDKHGPAPVGDFTDRGQLKTRHPDLANAPVYPLLLAGLMEVAPGIRYQEAGGAALKVGTKSVNAWTRGGYFSVYPPDFWISLFNQFLFLIMVVMVFFLARQLFDLTVAWMSAIVFLGTDLFWRFCISGLSTMLAMLIFLALAWCLTLLEQHARSRITARSCVLLAALAGVLLGLGCLTRYAFGWLIIPTLVFLLLFSGSCRWSVCLSTLAAFAVVISPWVIRNYYLSHTPFGTAGFAMYENTPYFVESRLQRSLNPDLSRGQFYFVLSKAITNSRNILQEELPKFTGSWVGAFFLVGLMINFKNPTLNRLRYFILLCLPVLVVAQAVGHTQLSDDSPVINSENLLVLVAPLVTIFGVSLFFMLLDQINLPDSKVRYVFIGIFGFVICLPAVLNIFSTRANPIQYPPYYPPTIQKTANWMKEGELIMSDIPWAVAWYGQRQSLWLTLNADSDFEQFTDYQKTISAIYLTPVTTDSHILTQLVRSGEKSWGSFLLESMLSNKLPVAFPLHYAPVGFLPEQLFLTDSERWVQPQPIAETAPK
jgi:hypothetical protein